MKFELKILLLTLIIIGLSACNRNRSADQEPPALFMQPQTVELNTDEGYVINRITGDSIEPIINSEGDTVQTGVPIPALGWVIHPDSVDKPISYRIPPANQLTRIDAYPNVYSIPEELTIIPVDKEALTVIPIEKITENDTTHYLINNSGARIKTGVPVRLRGKPLHINQPQATRALPPRFKEAATTNMQYLDVDQGLADNGIYCILEDKSGNLWFGTDGGGVIKYDGQSFTQFTEEAGLSSNSVRSILQDKSGNIWFGTQNGGGLIRYDGKSFTNFTEEEGFSSNTIWSIHEDTSGNLWFGTIGGGVSKYDGQSFTYFTEKEGLSGNSVMSIVEDSSGNLWFATYGGGASKYDGAYFTHFTEKEGLSDNYLRSMQEDRNGNLWFGTLRGGVSKYDGESYTWFTEEEGLVNNTVFSMLEDSQGNLWFGTRGGVSKFDGQSFTHITEKEGLSYNVVVSIQEDTSGNLWFGTYGGGLSIYNGQSFVHLSEKEGLTNSSVRSILQDKSGNLWFGTDNGLNRYNGESFTQYTKEEGLSGNVVYSILEDRNGDLWFGTRGGGVSKFDGQSFTHYTEKQGLLTNEVFSIFEDSNGNLWFGTWGARGGLCRYDGNFFTHYNEKEGLLRNNAYNILEDRNGNLWFSGRFGLYKYDGQSFTHYTEKEGLLSNSIHSIMEDSYGNLWFGSRGGVSKFDGQTFTHFTEKEGLTDNIVLSILEDTSGSLWFGTGRGLTNLMFGNGDDFNPKQLSPEQAGEQEHNKTTIRRYLKNDGLKSMSFRSAHIDDENRIWWGTGKGLTMLDLSKHVVSTSPPDVYLKGLDINEQLMDYRNLSDSLGQEIEFGDIVQFENYPLDLELPYNKNHLTFHFVAIDWSAPHQIRYSYIMEGLNSSWSQPTTETKADYRNLPYGNYDFKVRAIGVSGEWSEAFTYAFTIHPPWWHTWWARMGYGILAVLIVYGFVRWRTAKLQQRQKELETEVEVATQVIREQKEEVEKEKERSETLLLNILPEEVAEELKEKGHSDAQLIDEVTVLFTDFKGFTALSEKVSPKELVSDLHNCFTAFDNICEKYGIEKIKTIGDSYMAAGGLPTPNTTHAQDVVNAALEMAAVIEEGKAKKIAADLPFFEIRIGIHSGPVVAGIVGVKKFQYDIWGDTVNTASRMESSGVVGKVNASQATVDRINSDPEFVFQSRGKIAAKGKGEMEMYLVSKVKA